MTRHTQEDDFYNSGNLDEAPGMGHNGGPGWDPEAEEIKRLRRLELMAEDEKSLAARARKTLLVNLLQMIEDGTAMPQDMANLRQLLKDNGVIMGDPLEGDKGDQNPKRAEAPRPLPSFDVPDYDT